MLTQEAEAKIYELLAKVFAKEPSSEFLKLLQAEQNQQLLNSDNIDCFSDIKHFSFAEQAEKIAIEYSRLFLLSGENTALCESLQRREGRLWGKSTAQVNSIYNKFGFSLDEDFNDTPDHLSAELSFLAQLSKLELEYSQRNLKSARKGVLEVKKYFLKNHLCEWFFQLESEIYRQAKLLYYKGFARLTAAFLKAELESLAEITDI